MARVQVELEVNDKGVEIHGPTPLPERASATQWHNGYGPVFWRPLIAKIPVMVEDPGARVKVMLDSSLVV